MNLKTKLIISSWLVILINNFLYSQDRNPNKDSTNFEIKKEIFIDSLSNSSSKFNSNYDFSELIKQGLQLKILDSLKSITELTLFSQMIKDQLLENLFKDIDKRNRTELFLKTTQTHFQSQPKTDLGEIGKYLGLSKNVMAIILLIIHLSRF